jgi:hypothetical protein
MKPAEVLSSAVASFIAEGCTAALEALSSSFF